MSDHEFAEDPGRLLEDLVDAISRVRSITDKIMASQPDMVPAAEALIARLRIDSNGKQKINGASSVAVTPNEPSTPRHPTFDLPLLNFNRSLECDRLDQSQTKRDVILVCLLLSGEKGMDAGALEREFTRQSFPVKRNNISGILKRMKDDNLVDNVSPASNHRERRGTHWLTDIGLQAAQAAKKEIWPPDPRNGK